MRGERLKQLRADKRLTQQELADIFRIPRGTYAHYEIGKREPDNAILAQFADFFGVTTDYLIGRDIKPEIISFGGSSTPQLSDDELALIEKYRRMKDDEKDTLHKVANHIAPDEQAAASGK